MIAIGSNLKNRDATHHCDVVVVGAGIVGISTAYYLTRLNPDIDVVVVDAAAPMSLTSALSGENYRNWWPHPTMTAFTDHSIDLMETIAKQTNNRIQMNRRGYVLATRSNNIDELMVELESGYQGLPDCEIRVHGKASSAYQKADNTSWMDAPAGVDVLRSQTLVQKTFPEFQSDINSIVHIRRAGDISGQQLGQHMLEHYRKSGGRLVNAEICNISVDSGFTLKSTDESVTIKTSQLVNAAGPFVNDIAAMVGTQLPVTNILQQKIAFDDRAGVISRQMPFTIDLDAQTIDWSEEEAALLRESPEFGWLTKQMPGAVHCRPDGGDSGTWVKLGWAFNSVSTEPDRAPALPEEFPEIVLRGASRLLPALKRYEGHLPKSMSHYGGYYTLTTENWPLIGPMDVENSYVAGALSGFGTMAACASGDLCARWVLGETLPGFAADLAPQRYQNQALMAELTALNRRGIL